MFLAVRVYRAPCDVHLLESARLHIDDLPTTLNLVIVHYFYLEAAAGQNILTIHKWQSGDMLISVDGCVSTHHIF